MDELGAFDQAAGCLPRSLRLAALGMDEPTRRRCEELHFRVGRKFCWSDAEGEYPVPQGPEQVRETDLRLVVELATGSSFHSALEGIRSGYIPLPGGHRLGLCGTVTTEEGEVKNFLHLSSLNLRIAREKPEAGAGLLPQLCAGGRLESTLILSPPGHGKTTLLRDLVRRLSDGTSSLRVGLVDQRGEVAALRQGVPQLDVGRHTDVMEGCPKGVGLMLLLRGMNPQVLALDEITQPEDVEGLLQGAGCGVSLLATAHGRDREDLARRPLYAPLLRGGIFTHLLRIDLVEGKRVYTLEDFNL
jgi:stage III sporulation protein AA